MREIVIDDTVLNEIVRRLVEAVDPDRIILFGSRARGDARPDSDIDLLIIKDTDQPSYRRAIPAYRALTGMGIRKTLSGGLPRKCKTGLKCRPTSPLAR